MTSGNRTIQLHLYNSFIHALTLLMTTSRHLTCDAMSGSGRLLMPSDRLTQLTSSAYSIVFSVLSVFLNVVLK